MCMWTFDILVVLTLPLDTRSCVVMICWHDVIFSSRDVNIWTRDVIIHHVVYDFVMCCIKMIHLSLSCPLKPWRYQGLPRHGGWRQEYHPSWVENGFWGDAEGIVAPLTISCLRLVLYLFIHVTVINTVFIMVCIAEGLPPFPVSIYILYPCCVYTFHVLSLYHMKYEIIVAGYLSRYLYFFVGCPHVRDVCCCIYSSGKLFIWSLSWISVSYFALFDGLCVSSEYDFFSANSSILKKVWC